MVVGRTSAASHPQLGLSGGRGEGGEEQPTGARLLWLRSTAGAAGLLAWFVLDARRQPRRRVTVCQQPPRLKVRGMEAPRAHTASRRRCLPQLPAFSTSQAVPHSLRTSSPPPHGLYFHGRTARPILEASG